MVVSSRILPSQILSLNTQKKNSVLSSYSNTSILFSLIDQCKLGPSYVERISCRKLGVNVGVKPMKRNLIVSAAQADDFTPSEMTHESALKLLGVRDGASFDEILRAKNTCIDKCGGDQERLMMIETAYDILLMQSLSKRRAGQGVDNSVRFADVKKSRPKSSNTPAWLNKATNGAPVSIQSPSSKTLTVQAAVYGSLALWTFVGGINSGEDVISSGSDVPGAQLALAFIASLYFLRQDNVKLGKATLLTTGGLVVGALLGSLVEAWLRVDIFPVFGISSPSVVASEFAFLVLWLSSSFVR